MTLRSVSLSSETPQPIIRTTPPIHSLPQEPLEKIFSFLNQYDLQATALVSHTMKARVITTANLSELSSIKDFIHHLTRWIDVETSSVQRSLLAKISQNITLQNFANLLLLKGYIFDVKDQLINVIKTLDAITTNNLKIYIHPPKFMEDIFELAEIERLIDEANLILGERQRGDTLQRISGALIQAGNIDRAIDVATSITHETFKGAAIRYIFEALIQMGNIDRAIAVSAFFQNDFIKGVALQRISEALIRAGNIDKAIDIATSIPRAVDRGEALHNISKALILAGNIDRAITVATSIPRMTEREKTFENIFNALSQTGDIDRLFTFITYISVHMKDEEDSTKDQQRELLLLVVILSFLSLLAIPWPELSIAN